jgi:hypothetical protein
VNDLRKCYALGTVILLWGITSSAAANTADCISGPLGTGNPSACTDADRKHYEELQKEADAAALAIKAAVANCFNARMPRLINAQTSTAK